MTCQDKATCGLYCIEYSTLGDNLKSDLGQDNGTTTPHRAVRRQERLIAHKLFNVIIWDMQQGCVGHGPPGLPGHRHPDGILTFQGIPLPLFDWQGKGRLSMHSCPVVPLLVAIVLIEAAGIFGAIYDLLKFACSI